MSEAKPRSRRLRRIGAVVVVLAAVALAAWLFTDGPAILTKPGTATGDELDIKLVGWWPGTTGDIHDAAGDRIGESVGNWHRPCVGGSSLGARFWYYIFESGADSGSVAFASLSYLTLPGKPEPIEYFSLEPGPSERPGLTRYVGEIFFRPERRRPLRNKALRNIPILSYYLMYPIPINEVDLYVRWYEGPRQEAFATFVGPFEPGMALGADAASGVTLHVADFVGTGDDWGTWLDVNSAVELPRQTEILVYDASGRRYKTMSRSGSGSSLAAVAPHLTPADISAVTVGEKAKTRVFHRVSLRPSSRRAIPDVAPHLVTAAERLGPGVTPGQIEDRQYQSVQEVVKVADLLRGNALRNAIWYLRSELGQPWVRLTDEERSKLREAAIRLTKSEFKFFVWDGLDILSMVDLDAFVTRVCEMLPTADRESSERVTHNLIHRADRLTDEQVRRLAMTASSFSSTVGAEGIVEDVLCKCPSPEATAALTSFAGGAEPWLWWPATRESVKRHALEPPSELSGVSLPRLLAVTGLKDVQSVDAKAADEAKDVLLSVLTPEVAVHSSAVFREALDIAAQCCDRTAVTGKIVSFLREVRDYPRTGECIARETGYLNTWNGTAIAEKALADDVDPYKRPWRRIVLDALAWADSGIVPVRAVDDSPAKAGDLRVLLICEADPELSGIGLWRSNDSPVVVGESDRVLSSDSVLDFYMTSRAGGLESSNSARPRALSDRRPFEATDRSRFNLPKRSDLCFEGTLRIPHSQRVLHFYLRRDKLPLELDINEDGRRLIIEPADSPDSVLAGLEAFDDWWAKYGPGTPAALDATKNDGGR